MLRGTRSTHHQLPVINNRAQWALLMKGEVLLPAVTFLVAFEEGAAGKWEGGRKGVTAAGQLQINHSEWAEDVRERDKGHNPWGSGTDFKKLTFTSVQHRGAGETMETKNISSTQHWLKKEARPGRVRGILPQLKAVYVDTEKWDWGKILRWGKTATMHSLAYCSYKRKLIWFTQAFHNVPCFKQLLVKKEEKIVIATNNTAFAAFRI